MPCHAEPPPCKGSDLDYDGLDDAGRQHFRLDRNDEALLCFRLARALRQNGTILWNEALTLERLGYLDEALDLFELAARNHPEDLGAVDAGDYFKGVSNLRAQVGVIAVSANVDGYEVYVDGRLRPAADRIVRGEFRVVGGAYHTVRIEHPDFEPFEQGVTVPRKGRVELSLTLRPMSGGWVQFEERSASPGRTSVVIDGEDQHTLPWEGRIPPGTHTVWTTGPNTGSAPIVVRVLDKTVARVDLSSTTLGAPTLLETDPPDALVAIGGAELPRKLRRLSLPPGTYELSVGAPGYDQKRLALEVVRDGPERKVQVALTMNGSHPMSAYRGHGWLEVHGAVPIGLTFNSDITADCPEACSSDSPVSGAIVGLRGGYRFGQGFAPELQAGFLRLGENVGRTKTDTFGNGGQHELTYVIQDDLRMLGLYVGGGASYRHSLLRWLDFVARFGAGLLFAGTSDQISGVARAGGTEVELETIERGPLELKLAAGYLWPEIGGILRLGSVDLGLSLGVGFVLGEGISPTGRTLKVTNEAVKTCLEQDDLTSGYAGCAPENSRLIKDEKLFRTFVVALPLVSLGYRFP